MHRILNCLRDLRDYIKGLNELKETSMYYLEKKEDF